MVESTLAYTRTQAERDDQHLSWVRPDRNFFAAGACHILAHVADSLDAHAGELVVIAPRDGSTGLHVYYRHGGWSFDFNGWAREEDLLAVTWCDYRAVNSHWDADVVSVDEPLRGLCRNYRMRPPAQYFAPPIDRARAYAGRLGVTMPHDRRPQG